MLPENYLFDPPVPQEYILGIGLVLAVFTVINYARAGGYAGRFQRTALGLFRLLIIAALTLILLRPMKVEIHKENTAKALLQVLVDTSKSMNTQDLDGAARIQAVAQGLKKAEAALRRLEQDFDVAYYAFDDKLRAATLPELMALQETEGQNTDIASALINAANVQPQRKKAGILLISDGRENQTNDIASAAIYLKSLNVPVWTTTVGADTQTRDLFVSARIDQSFVFAGQDSQLKVALGQSGYDGWYAKIKLFREGEPMGEQQIMLKGPMAHATFPIRESAKGLYQYTVEAVPLQGEADKGNNRRSVFVQVVEERSKVLFIEAQPYWDSKFLLRALQADPNLEVTSIFHMNEKKVLAITQAAGRKDTGLVRMPKTKEELYQYDCVILGRDVDHIFSAGEMKLFKDYVEERGGNLIFARGKAYSAKNDVLASLEPVVWEDGAIRDARLQLTALGSANPMFDFGAIGNTNVIIRELPEMISIARVQKEKTLAVVLAKGRSQDGAREIAAISYQRYAKGKVLSIGSSGLWRWAFTPEELSQYDPVYAKFWGQMIRWLIYGSDFLPGQDIAFRTDRNTFDLGGLASLVIQTKHVDAAAYRPAISIIAPDGGATMITPESSIDAPGAYSATYLPEMEGEYEAILTNNIGAPKQNRLRFTVYNNALETRYVSADPGLLNRVAKITGGATLDRQDWHKLRGLAKEFEYASREVTKPDDVWDKLLIFLAVAGVLALEWFGRRKAGLV